MFITPAQSMPNASKETIESLDRDERTLKGVILVILFLVLWAWVMIGIVTSAHAQQAPPKLSVEERIGKVMGPTIVKAALLENANEELQAIVAQRDKTIADLQAQIAELKKAQEPK